MDFTQEFAKQQPEDFVRAVFVRALSARCVVVGMDTRFGYRNSGDVSTLADLGEKFGFEVVTLDEARWLDLTIDGTDEFDGELNLIKGGGGALLQEKIVATASDQMIVIADTGKEVARLGAFPLPVEVIGFGWQTSKALIGEMLSRSTRCRAWLKTGYS